MSIGPWYYMGIFFIGCCNLQDELKNRNNRKKDYKMTISGKGSTLSGGSQRYLVFAEYDAVEVVSVSESDL